MTSAQRWIIRTVLLVLVPVFLITWIQLQQPDWLRFPRLSMRVFLLLSVLSLLAGWRFHRRDHLLHAWLILLCGMALWHWAPPSGSLLDPLGFNLLWFLTLILSLWFSIAPATGVRTLMGLANLILLMCVSLLFGLWINGQLPDDLNRLLEGLPGGFSDGSLTLPIGIAVLNVLVLVLQSLRERTTAYLATLGAVLTITIGFALRTDGTLPFLSCIFAQTILLIGVVDHLTSIAFLDALTGLPGRRALTPALQQLNGLYTIAVADIDHFKRFNDRYGHDVGDQVLRKVASILERPGSGGRAYRVGGEEFLLLFNGKALSDVEAVLDRLRKSIESEPFRIRDKGSRKRSDATKRGRTTDGRKAVKITVSIGMADSTGNESPRHTWKAADKALYRAKKRGRNRICK